MRVLLLAFAGLALLGLASGCGQAKGPAKRDSTEAIVGRRGGHPILRIGGMTIVFEGIISQGPDNPALGTSLVQVRGKKKSSVPEETAQFEDIRLTSSYTDGTADLSVSGQKFRVIDAGNKVQFTDASYPVHAGAKTVLVAQDGSTSLSR